MAVGRVVGEGARDVQQPVVYRELVHRAEDTEEAAVHIHPGRAIPLGDVQPAVGACELPTDVEFPLVVGQVVDAVDVVGVQLGQVVYLMPGAAVPAGQAVHLQGVVGVLEPTRRIEPVRIGTQAVHRAANAVL